MIALAHPPLRVAIVGGGFSGTLVAVHLLRQDRPVHIDLIDPRGAGRGLAYSTIWDEHLLNVPAVRMSAFGAEPLHFLEWLHANGKPNAAPDYFAPRKLYGTYLQALLETCIREASGRSRFRQHFSEATDLSYNHKRVRISLRNGDRIQTDKIVLATGNPSPRRQGDFGSPWEPGALAGLDPDRDVLLIGAGLTAVDAFLALLSQGHRAVIHVVSRRGQLPRVHASYRPLPLPFDATGVTTARGLMRAIRQAARSAEDWRAVIDSLRSVTNDIWTRLELSEQRRILRHAKTWWDVHRHRMAPEIGAKVQAARASGQLRIYAGRGQRNLDVQRVINCTGANEDYHLVPNPLIQALLDTGRIRPNFIGKGLQTNAHGALIDSDSVTSEWLLTLGPPRIGGLLETIAVPELRKQAEALASYLCSVIYEPIETPAELVMAAGI